jgi:hypothetical protein
VELYQFMGKDNVSFHSVSYCLHAIWELYSPGSVQGYQTCAKIALFGRCLRHYCIVEVKTPSCFRFLLFQPKYLYNCPIMKVKTPFCSQSFQCSSPQLIGSFPCYSISTMHLFVIRYWLVRLSGIELWFCNTVQ